MRTLVYPFDRQFLPILRNKFYPNVLEISALVSPPGWGYTNQDGGAIDCGNPCGLLVDKNFESKLSQVEAVFFAKSDHIFDKETYLLPKMEIAARQKKYIFCTCDLTANELQSIKLLCHSNGVELYYFNNNLSGEDFLFDEDSMKESVCMRDITVPVVMVLGLIENVGKFETQLALTQYFKESGYKTTLIASRSYGSLCGEFSVPKQLFDPKYNEMQKIVYFNHYVKTIEIKTCPDLIVIGVPGGLLPTNKKHYNRHGITAYEITRAIKPDAAIVCTYCDEYKTEYFDHLTDLCRYRFSCEISGYIMDNTLLEFNAQGLPEETSTMNISRQDMEKLNLDFSDCSLPIQTIYHRDKIFKYTLSLLEQYGDVYAL